MLSCCSKPVLPYFFCETQKTYFEKCFSDFFMYTRKVNVVFMGKNFQIPYFMFRRRKKGIDILVSAAANFIFDMNENEALIEQWIQWTVLLFKNILIVQLMKSISKKKTVSIKIQLL